MTCVSKEPGSASTGGERTPRRNLMCLNYLSKDAILSSFITKANYCGIETLSSDLASQERQVRQLGGRLDS
jgi:hypothetical protein